MNVSLLLPSEAQSPGGAPAPASPAFAATTIPVGGDFTKFMGLLGKTDVNKTTERPALSADAVTESGAEESTPLPGAALPAVDPATTLPDPEISPVFFDTSVANLRLVLRAEPVIPLAQQAEPAATGPGAEENAKAAEWMDLGQGKAVSRQTVQFGRSGQSTPSKNVLRSPTPVVAGPGKFTSAAPVKISVPEKSPAPISQNSQTPARPGTSTVAKKTALSISPPRPISSQVKPNAPVASAPACGNQTPVPTPKLAATHPVRAAERLPVSATDSTDGRHGTHREETLTPIPAAIIPVIDVNAVIPLLAAAAVPTVPSPLPVKSAAGAIGTETNDQTAPPADVPPSAGTGGQGGRIVSSMIVPTAAGPAHHHSAPAQLSDFPAPTSRETLNAIPLAAPVVIPSLPSPRPVKPAGRAVGSATDGKPAPLADMGSSTGAGGQSGRSTSNTIIRAVSGTAPLDNAPAPLADSFAPRSGESRSFQSAKPESIAAPSDLLVIHPGFVHQSNGATLHPEKISTPNNEGAYLDTAPGRMKRTPLPNPLPAGRGEGIGKLQGDSAGVEMRPNEAAELAPTPQVPPLAVQSTVTKEAPPFIPPQAKPDGTTSRDTATNAVVPSLAATSAPLPKPVASVQDGVATEPILPAAQPVDVAPVMPPGGQDARGAQPAEETAAANLAAADARPAPSPQPVAASVAEKLLTISAPTPPVPASAPPLPVATEAASSPLPPPSPDHTANNIIDLPAANPAPDPQVRSAGDHRVQADAEPAAKTPAVIPPTAADQSGPPNHAAIAADATPILAAPLPTAATPPPPNPAQPTPTPGSAESNLKPGPPEHVTEVKRDAVNHDQSAPSTIAATAARLPVVAPSAPAPPPTHVSKEVATAAAKITLLDKMTATSAAMAQITSRPGALTGTKEHVSAISPPPPPSGTPVAINESRMKSAVKVNEIAGSAVQVLPPAGQVAPLAGAPGIGSQGAMASRPIEIDFSNNKDNSAQWMVLNTTPAGNSNLTATANAGTSAVPAASAIAGVERMISREVTMVRQSGAQALAVTLKVDSHTSLFLQLTNHNGQIEASVRCEKGSPAGLDTHWGELQESLARQNVQLLPLQQNSPDPSKLPAGNAGDLTDRQPSRHPAEANSPQTAETEPPPSDEAMNAAVGLAKSKHRSHPRHGWEKWA